MSLHDDLHEWVLELDGAPALNHHLSPQQKASAGAGKQSSVNSSHNIHFAPRAGSLQNKSPSRECTQEEKNRPSNLANNHPSLSRLGIKRTVAQSGSRMGVLTLTPFFTPVPLYQRGARYTTLWGKSPLFCASLISDPRSRMWMGELVRWSRPREQAE